MASYQHCHGNLSQVRVAFDLFVCHILVQLNGTSTADANIKCISNMKMISFIMDRESSTREHGHATHS